MTNERLAAIDTLRGVALVAMVLYHLVWMLNLFGYTHFDLFNDPFWLFARAAILCSFLFISGFVMGLSGSMPRSWPRFFRRLGLLALAAGLVTLSTLWAFPNAYIFFGVLHCLAVGAVLALAFMRLPWWAVAVAALIWLSIPHLPVTPSFDQPWLLWLGLVSRLPVTNDYVPLFPWFGVVLLGLSIGKFAHGWPGWPALAERLPHSWLLSWPGRHSLPFYLAHPPIILGALNLLALILPPPAPVQDDTAAFFNQCLAGCQEIEGSVGECTTYCGCVLEGLHRADLWTKVNTTGIDNASQGQLIEITRRCSPEKLPIPTERPETLAE